MMLVALLLTKKLFGISIGLERLPFKNDGYKFWTWRGHKIHYVEQGEGFPIVLIHGFGASAFHWRSLSIMLFSTNVYFIIE